MHEGASGGGITDYGDEPFLEKLTIKQMEPLLFLNV